MRQDLRQPTHEIDKNDNAVFGVNFVAPTAAFRFIDSIPAWNKHWYDLQVVYPGLAVCVCDFSMCINAPTRQEKLLVWLTIKKTTWLKTSDMTCDNRHVLQQATWHAASNTTCNNRHDLRQATREIVWVNIVSRSKSSKAVFGDSLLLFVFSAFVAAKRVYSHSEIKQDKTARPFQGSNETQHWSD